MLHNNVFELSLESSTGLWLPVRAAGKLDRTPAASIISSVSGKLAELPPDILGFLLGAPILSRSSVLGKFVVLATE
jgi:hypothetical protein